MGINVPAQKIRLFDSYLRAIILLEYNSIRKFKILQLAF